VRGNEKIVRILLDAGAVASVQYVAFSRGSWILL